MFLYIGYFYINNWGVSIKTDWFYMRKTPCGVRMIKTSVSCKGSISAALKHSLELVYSIFFISAILWFYTKVKNAYWFSTVLCRKIKGRYLNPRHPPFTILLFSIQGLLLNSCLRSYQQVFNISTLRQAWETFGKHFKLILRILHEYIMFKKVPYNP